MILDKLWRLRWKRDKYSRKMDRAIRKAEKQKNHEERESLISEVMQELSLYDDETRTYLFCGIQISLPFIRATKRPSLGVRGLWSLLDLDLLCDLHL